jgi:hypothetical protein
MKATNKTYFVRCLHRVRATVTDTSRHNPRKSGFGTDAGRRRLLEIGKQTGWRSSNQQRRKEDGKNHEEPTEEFVVQPNSKMPPDED